MTNTTISYADGRTKETLLNGVVKTAYEYGPNWTKTYEGPTGLASPRWSCSYEDALGRTICETRPGFNGALLITSNEYNTANQLVATRSYAIEQSEQANNRILSSTLICYNNCGEKNLTVSDMNLNGQIDWNDTDRIVSNDTRYISLNGDWWRESSTWQTRQNGSSELTLMGLTRTRLTGLGDGLVSETRSIDPLGNETVACSYLDRATHTTTRTVTTPASSLAAETVVQSGLTLSSRSPTGVTTTYAYDALGRQVSQTDGRGNTSQIVYDEQGRVAKTIDPLGNETAYAYDALGRQVAVTDPLGHTVTTTYDAEGRVTSQRGATYPVDYAYDAYGNKVSMTTYRNESDVPMVGGDVPGAPHAGDTTRWFYDEPSGCMTNKVYADGKGPFYSYTPDGKLARRTWARGIATDYTYDNAGQLVLTSYSDDTPTITMSYDRVGNLINATTAGVITNLYAYDIVGHCTNEWQNDFQLTSFYDALGRSTGYAINGTRQTTIAYDSFGRIATMSVPSGQSNNPNNRTIEQFSWAYLPGSDLKASLQYPNGLTASWTYDANNKLLQVCNATPTNVISQFDYTYDAAGRRVSIAKSGTAFGDLSGSIDAYTYNTRSELTSARRTKNGQPIPGFSEDFDYDTIGNRRSSMTYNERGEAQTSTYQANNLNQYTSRTTPGYAAVRGEADPNATVTVNENPTFRLGSYYFGSDLFDNTAASGLANLETYATLSQTAANGDEADDLVSATTNQVYLAHSPETFAYDDDGNQTLITTKTGLWRVTYNGENRPVLWVHDSDNTTLAMSYDHMGRRREKNNQLFVYGGYLQVADNGGNAYVWDCTEPVATRPLKWIRDNSSAYYTHDGNKNVSEVIAADGSMAAHYEYAPFGAVTTQRGTSSASNPWRFSSEFAEDDTATVYYNYRHYDPVMGRWLNREEFAIESVSPYLYLANHSILTSDRLGLYDELFHFYLMYLIMHDITKNDDMSLLYALGSQIPDSGYFDAMKEKVVPSQSTLKVRRLYHNLNGLTCCQLEKFKKCIKERIQEVQDPFLQGVYLHAFADTFAHVELGAVKNGNPCSYEERWGHAKDFKKPDDIRYENLNGEEVGKDRFWNLISQIEILFGRGISADLRQFLQSLYARDSVIIHVGGPGSVCFGGAGYTYTYSRYIYTKAEIDKMIKERARAKGLDNEDWEFPYGGDRDKRQEKVNLIIENVEPKLQECLDRAKGK